MPLPIAAILLSVLGSAISAGAAKRNADARAKARNDVLDRTMARNDRFTEDSRNLLDDRMAQYQPAANAAQQADLAADREATIASGVQQTAVEDIPLGGSAPEVVKSEIAKRLLDAFQRGTSEAKARAKVGSYGDTWFKESIDNSNLGASIAENNNFARGNLAIMPHQQDAAELAASKTGRFGSLIGSVMMGAGNFMGSAGGGGAGFGGGGYFASRGGVPIPRPNPLFR